MKDNPNKTSAGDITHSLIKGGLGTIPVIGSLATEIFGLVVTPPLEKRRAAWMNEIAEKLNILEEKRLIDFKELADDERFVDVVLQATTLALKTSEREKINAFQSAVLNTASGECPDQTISQIFLNQLDRFTTWHIKILKFIDSPILWYQKANRTPPSFVAGSISTVIKDAFPELKEENDLLEIIWNDLRTAGFHRTSDIRTSMTGGGAISERTTPLGKQFLKFITK